MQKISIDEFRDRKIKELAEEFFHEHDIQPIWR